jgi:long-chain acyl-CoA synthetase
MPLTRTVLEVAGTHPDQRAIVGADGSLTYAELVEDSRRLFAAVDTLHRAQATPPTPAPETRGIPITATCITSAFHTARVIGGLAGFRAVSAVIDPRWPLEHRVGVVLTTGIGLVIVDDGDTEFADALAARGWTGTVIGLSRLRALEQETAPAPPPTVREDDEAFLMLFSSGTTSAPKAFLKTRQQYRANVAVSAAHLEPFPGVATLAPGPVSYSLTLYAVIESLATGGSIHLADAFDPLEDARRIEAERITRIVAVPAVARALSDVARRDPMRLAGLDLVVVGGANLPAAIRDGLSAALPQVRLISYYGAAEIGFIGDSREGDGTRISLYDGIEAEIREPAGNNPAGNNPAGNAPTGSDRADLPVPEGELGEVWIHAAACSDDYLAGTTDEHLQGEGGWATVHDQGRLVDGKLELVGRAGDIVVSGGHKVALTEVERAFEDLPGAPAVCAVAVPAARLGSIVVLVLEHPRDNDPTGTAATGDALTKDALRSHGRAHLAPQFVPRRFYLMDSLPRTVGGKIRRSEVTDLLAHGRGTRL